MSSKSSRREFIKIGSAAAASIATGAQAAPPQSSTSADHQHHDDSKENEFPRTHAGRGGAFGSASDRGKLVSGFRSATESPVHVVMPDLEKLPWQMKDGAKEFHLVAEHVRREILPDMTFDFWGFNGSMPGPMIEAVEGDRVRIIVHNNLPEGTTVHWHGLELPIAMDGVPGLTQDPIPPGKTFKYEFDLHQNGTFFYHSHGAMQEIMGMTGLFVIHPSEPHVPVVDHDFGLIMQEFAILPQSTVPNSVSEQFNFFTINGRSGPYLTPLVVRLGSRVRIRFMNLSAMDNHPMHLHGHTFWMTGTEGGRIPESAWVPSNNVLVGVGQSRDVEFIANNPGDWMLHCHILHHMMNHMVSMVGPMAMPGPMIGMQHGPPVPGAMPAMRGAELASGELGAGLARSLGPMTSSDRDIMNGMRPSEMEAKFKVPGYPQDMMDMKEVMMPPGMMAKVNVPLTRGMRRNWATGVDAMMTVVRVLPDDLYDQVISGKGEIKPGASVPGGGPGKAMMHKGQQMHGEMDMSEEHNMHEPQPFGTSPPASMNHQHHER